MPIYNHALFKTYSSVPIVWFITKVAYVFLNLFFKQIIFCIHETASTVYNTVLK